MGGRDRSRGGGGGEDAHQHLSTVGEFEKERTRLGWMCVCVNRQKCVSHGETVRVGGSPAGMGIWLCSNTPTIRAKSSENVLGKQLKHKFKVNGKMDF